MKPRHILPAIFASSAALVAPASALDWDRATTTGIQAGNGNWNTTDLTWSTNGTTLVAWTNGNTATFQAGSSRVTVASGISATTIASNVPGSNAVEFVDAQNLSFTTYNINGGKVRFNGVTSSQNTGNIVINSNGGTGVGGTLYVAGTDNIARTITASGTGNGENLGALRIESGGTISGNVALTATAGAPLITIGGNGSGTSTISGIISGTGGINKYTSTTLNLTGSNTYSGATTVTLGTLSVGHANALGNTTGAVTVAGGTLALGSVNLNKSAIALNSGTLTGSAYTQTVNIGGNSAISGTFSGIVNAGTSAARAINTTGGLSVGTLNGQGTFSGGLVTVTTALNPGNSPGIQNYGSGLTIDSANVTTEIDLTSYQAGNGAGLAFDEINVTGTLTINNPSTWSIAGLNGVDYTNTFWDTDRTIELIKFGTLAGSFGTTTPGTPFTGADPSQGSWSFVNDGNSYNAVWDAVPEPSAPALIGSLGALALLRRRRA